MPVTEPTVTLPVCPLEDLPPGNRRIVQHGKISIGVFNVNDELYAVRNYCPHEGAELCKGPLTGTNLRTDNVGEMNWGACGYILRCPWHAWEFDIRNGASFTATRVKVKTYPVEVRRGVITILLKT